jgi:hypothetical protein
MNKELVSGEDVFVPEEETICQANVAVYNDRRCQIDLAELKQSGLKHYELNMTRFYLPN